MQPRPLDPSVVQRQLDELPEPAEPLDVVMVDGFLCAVLLRERPLPAERWFPLVFDIDRRAIGASAARSAAERALLQRREELERAIDRRDWFDPWIFELAGTATPTETVLPWAAGFALAAEHFGLPPACRRDVAGREALALIYQFVDAADWPAATELADAIAELEPPASLTEAVEDLVRGVLLLADATRAGGRGSTTGAA